MRMTCRVVEEQNALRKNFIKAYRKSEMKAVAAEHFLDNLVTQLCHPEGIFHDPESWPSSWALDPTEGPNRERRRLMYSHLTFDKKFVQRRSVDKVKKREKSPPLFHLLKGLCRANSLFLSWSYENLVDIYKRHHLLKDTALEIFLSDGQTYLIVFEDQSVSVI
ncbi:unnamed protein product [Gongylonema pulchrum]|uniref:BEACH-type PH domain-containing protein n=1 Tax=Gongylonema pulchrum TaxID=637853 RepID=A0A183EMC0_9BILA|nr:unnamed protein product [Gongylonema pulchrum]